MVNVMQWTSNIPITPELCDQFARAYLSNGRNQFEAGKTIWPADANKGLALGIELMQNPDVLAKINELVDTKGETAFLPKKDEVARQIWDFTTSQGKFSGRRIDSKEILAGFKLYADVMGYIEKPQAAVNIQNNTNTMNKVMIMPMHATEAEWEDAAIKQQQQLIEDANNN